MRRDRGFTLIELVIVMIVISVGLLGLASLFSNTATALSTNEALQQAAQTAQQCAERALSTRRQSFAALNSFSCGLNPDATPVAIVTSYSGSACPSGLSCVQVSINVRPTSALSSSITVMLVNSP